MTPKNPHASNELTNFLEKIGGRISDDTWHSMKVHLQGIVIFFSMRKYPFLKAQYTLINIPWNCVIIKLKVGIFVCFCMTDF